MKIAFLLVAAAASMVTPSKVTPSILENNAPLEEEVRCLAENIYFEARNESVMGQIAVAYVTLNRVFAPKHPDTICGVVKQGEYKESWKTKATKDPNDAIFIPVKDRCQFSWYCDGKSDKVLDLVAWKSAVNVAAMVTVEYGSKRHNDPTDGALWYHADYVQSKFHSKLSYTTTIGTHIFYR
jgi:spore germination cell wall hydrolase CwlJ-like protein